MQQVNKERIKELRAWARDNLAGKKVYHNELNNNINFTMTGLKEYLNQPHEFYYEKNEMIKDIQNIFKKSEYKGYNKYMEKISHIFETEIKGEKSWIIANERKDGKITFYSISDSNKVLKGIKK